MKILVNNIERATKQAELGNLEKLTFAQLRGLVPDTEGKKTPKIRQLLEAKPEILFQVESDEKRITVYRNGFCTCEKDAHVTVYSISYCRKIRYRFDDGTSLEVDEKEYEHSHFLMPLELIGEHRLEENAEDRIEYQHGFALMTDGSEWRKELSTDDFLTQLEQEDLEKTLEQIQKQRIELLYKALDTLNQRQALIVELHFHKGMTYRQIAEELQISHQSVAESMKWAIKKLKKYFEKYGKNTLPEE